MSESILGKLVGPEVKRDASHVAYAPVTATETLWPGQHIGFTTSSQENVGRTTNPIGVVDPFLPEHTPIRPGDRFLILLYPNTVSGLRHEWSHPAFLPTDAVQQVPQAPADKASQAIESARWIEAFAASHDKTYDQLMKACFDYLKEDGGDRILPSIEDDGDLWQHYQNITGISRSVLEAALAKEREAENDQYDECSHC